MDRIVVTGGGGYARAIIGILKKIKSYDIIGYTDDTDKKDIFGVKYVGDDRVLKRIKSEYKCYRAIIGIGSTSLPDITKRIKIQNMLDSYGYEQPVIISPDAVINQDVKIGKGTVVFDGAVINCGVKIGESVSINTNCTIEHDCIIGDNVYISPGVTLCGGVYVGDRSFIGAGAVVIQYKSIGDNCIVGAGAVVVNDCLKPGKYLGVPAKLAT